MTNEIYKEDFFKNDPDLSRISFSVAQIELKKATPKFHYSKKFKGGLRVSPERILKVCDFSKIRSLPNEPYFSLFAGAEDESNICHDAQALEPILWAVMLGQPYIIQPHEIGSMIYTLATEIMLRSERKPSDPMVVNAIKLFERNAILSSFMHETILKLKFVIVIYFAFPVDGPIGAICERVVARNSNYLWKPKEDDMKVRSDNPNYKPKEAVKAVSSTPALDENADIASYIIMLPEKVYQIDMYWSCKGWSNNRDDALVFASQHAAHTFFRPHATKSLGYKVVEA